MSEILIMAAFIYVVIGELCWLSSFWEVERHDGSLLRLPLWLLGWPIMLLKGLW